MNRLKRDYCLKGHHPRWKAWKYNSHICDYCGAECGSNVQASGMPINAIIQRSKILNGIISLSAFHQNSNAGQ